MGQDVVLTSPPTGDGDGEQEKQQQTKEQEHEQAREQDHSQEVTVEQEQQRKQLTPAQIAELDSSIDADKGRDHDGGLDLEMF